MSTLNRTDPQLARILQAEDERQNGTLELIASENHASAPVLDAMGSVLTDKYAEGYPGRRWYCGCENMDAVEQLAIDRAKLLFGAEHANVQPHSGTTANMAVYLAALNHGETIMGMRLDQGGHLSHGLDLNLSGKYYHSVFYGVREDTEQLDLDQIREQALKEKPALLICGASAYPRAIDFEGMGAIAQELGCPLLSDVAHIAGLIVGGVHPDPVPHSDYVTTTTHKTLRGPRGGLVLCRRAYARKIDQAVFPGLQGGPLMHVIAAKAVSFLEAMRPEFKHYAQAIVANAKALAEALQERGWRLVSGGTDNHLMLVDLRCAGDEDLEGDAAAKWLAAAGIIANKNAIPFDPRPPSKPSGIRLGTPALTTRGMGAAEMRQIAAWIDQVLRARGDDEVVRAIRDAVAQMCLTFAIPSSYR